MNEADAVVSLCSLEGDKFSYALANGIVGVYSGQERFWRIKVRIAIKLTCTLGISDKKPCSLLSYGLL